MNQNGNIGILNCEVLSNHLVCDRKEYEQSATTVEVVKVVVEESELIVCFETKQMVQYLYRGSSR